MTAHKNKDGLLYPVKSAFSTSIVKTEQKSYRATTEDEDEQLSRTAPQTVQHDEENEGAPDNRHHGSNQSNADGGETIQVIRGNTDGCRNQNQVATGGVPLNIDCRPFNTNINSGARFDSASINGGGGWSHTLARSGGNRNNVGCTDCTNCRDCVTCVHCVNSRDCVNCVDCENCRDCVGLKGAKGVRGGVGGMGEETGWQWSQQILRSCSTQ